MWCLAFALAWVVPTFLIVLFSFEKWGSTSQQSNSFVCPFFLHMEHGFSFLLDFLSWWWLLWLGECLHLFSFLSSPSSVWVPVAQSTVHARGGELQNVKAFHKHLTLGPSRPTLQQYGMTLDYFHWLHRPDRQTLWQVKFFLGSWLTASQLPLDVSKKLRGAGFLLWSVWEVHCWSKPSLAMGGSRRSKPWKQKNFVWFDRLNNQQGPIFCLMLGLIVRWTK